MSDKYFEHQELVKRFEVLVSQKIPSLRIFDRHVGLFYAKRSSEGVIDYTPIKINKPGMADAYGILKTPYGFNIHLEFEFKTGKAVQSKDQKEWESFINNFMSGPYFLIRNEHEGVNEIIKFMNKIKDNLKCN